MSIFNVFNIGSGHTSSEPDQTISVLASQCIYTGATAGC